mmetsp:Transcript_76166/g.227005  ORF Transcript_76166/g.227005 Transcript_76166/m.227005 type:complete len:401 (+) Transcript_76166:78-1280(+)
MSKSAAPDVDLKSQGLPCYAIVSGIAIVVSVLLLGRGAQPVGEDGEQSSPFWLLWLVLWGLVRLVQVCLGILFILLCVLVARQRSIIYVPVPPGTQRSPSNNPYEFRSPATWRLPYEDAWIFTEDGTRLHAWFVYQAPEKLTEGEVPYTFVYFHGNAGNIGHRLQNIKQMHERLRINILIVDYRGYGDSEDGDGPSERGFLKDAVATYRWLVERIRNPPTGQHPRMSADRILLFGRSIGGVVAVRLFAQLLEAHLSAWDGALPLPAGLMLENTFTSISAMAVEVFPFLRAVSLLLRPPLIFDQWSAVDSIKFLSRNYRQWCCCLLSGLQDELVPPSQMRHLHSLLKENRPKVLKYFLFAEGGHNDTPHKGGEEYWISCRKFMDLVAETEAERLSGRNAQG